MSGGIDIPHTTYYPKLGLAELEELVKYPTGITGHLAAIPYVTLAKDGQLWIRPGFIYDYGSGPAIDDPAMMYASVVHDCLYDMMIAGELPWKHRKAADKIFRKMLREAGSSRFRAWYAYHGVRLGYPIFKNWKKKERRNGKSAQEDQRLPRADSGGDRLDERY